MTLKVLVTGGAGYIGCRLVPSLLQEHHQVTVLDTLEYGADGLLGWLDNPKLEVVRGSVHPIPDSMRHREFDVILHLAALVGEPACARDRSIAHTVNVDGTKQVLEEIKSKHFVFFSTCSNYGIVPPDTLADETTALTPQGLYAETKIKGEQIVRDRADHLILRLATICGLSPRMRFDTLVNEVAQRVGLSRPVEFYNVSARRPFLHINDLLHFIKLLLIQYEHQPDMGEQHNIPRPRTINLVGENLSKWDLLHQLIEVAPTTAPVFRIVAQNSDPRDYAVSAEMARRHYLFIPDRTVKDAMREIIRSVTLLAEPDRPIYRNVA